MAIRSAAAGTSTTLGFTNQPDGDFSNTQDAALEMQRSRSPAMPCGFGGAVSNLGDDEGILVRSGIFGM